MSRDCPITQNVIAPGHEYVLRTADGKHEHAFNIHALDQWVSSGRSVATNPVTRQPLDAATVRNIKDLAKTMRDMGYAPREDGTRVPLTRDDEARVRRERRRRDPWQRQVTREDVVALSRRAEAAMAIFRRIVEVLENFERAYQLPSLGYRDLYRSMRNSIENVAWGETGLQFTDVQLQYGSSDYTIVDRIERVSNARLIDTVDMMDPSIKVIVPYSGNVPFELRLIVEPKFRMRRGVGRVNVESWMYLDIESLRLAFNISSDDEGLTLKKLRKLLYSKEQGVTHVLRTPDLLLRGTLGVEKEVKCLKWLIALVKGLYAEEGVEFRRLRPEAYNAVQLLQMLSGVRLRGGYAILRYGEHYKSS